MTGRERVDALRVAICDAHYVQTGPDGARLSRRIAESIDAIAADLDALEAAREAAGQFLRGQSVDVVVHFLSMTLTDGDAESMSALLRALEGGGK